MTAVSVSSPAQDARLAISGMTCTACAARIEKALSHTPGVASASVNFALEQADVTFDPAKASVGSLIAAVEDVGYGAVPKLDMANSAEDPGAAKRETWALAISALLTLPLVGQMIGHLAGSGFHFNPWIEVALTVPVQFFIGARFYVSAWRAVKNGAANMDVLVVLGTTAAFAYSFYLVVTAGHGAMGRLYFEASAVVITLVLLGKGLETRAKRATSKALRALMELRPETARVLRDGIERDVPVSEVARGDIVIVKPGGRIPVDGEVDGGCSENDESLITGESLPVTKTVGAFVIGGAINGTGFLHIRATTVGADSTLSKIIQLVAAAQAGKAPVQKLVDRVSAVFVPVVVGIAVLTFAGWMVRGHAFEPALLAAVSVLVIACPCALGLATPTALIAGTGAAARAGILFSDVAALDHARRVDTVIFDKTGTLTEGKPKVVAVETFAGDEKAMIETAASLQAGSEHPLAKAVLDYAGTFQLQTVTDFRAVSGKGVTGKVGGESVAIGNAAFLAEQGVALNGAVAKCAAYEGQGKTAVLVARGGKVVGLIAITDTARHESREAIEILKAGHVASVMLSGDAQGVAGAIGKELGLTESRGGMKPEDKAAEIATRRKQGHVVAMVGDGINDAPALAAADVGIAMGTGTDVAMATAGVTLMRPDLRLVPEALNVSRLTWRKIRQNLFWAFIYNVVGIPLAALGLLSPIIAGAAMAASSVSVVTNSLLLTRWKPKLK